MYAHVMALPYRHSYLESKCFPISAPSITAAHNTRLESPVTKGRAG